MWAVGRSEMRDVAEKSIDDAWCEDETVPWTLVSREICDARSEAIEIQDIGSIATRRQGFFVQGLAKRDKAKVFKV
jgi:hypothetical protein